MSPDKNFQLFFSETIDTPSSLLEGTLPYETMFHIIVRNYERMTHDRVLSRDQELILDEVFEWYHKTYHQDSPNYEHTRRLCATQENIDAFVAVYSKSIFKKCLNGTGKPTVSLILNLAVAFKFTVDECDKTLSLFGFLPLHAKNILHLAVYSVLTDMEQHPETFDSDFGQFQRWAELCTGAIEILSHSNTDISTLPREPKKFVPSKRGGSSTKLFNFVRRYITCQNYVEFVSRHKNELNESRSRLRDEYFRLTNILVDIFDVGWGPRKKLEGNSLYLQDNSREYGGVEEFQGFQGEHRFYYFLNYFCKRISTGSYKETVVSQLKRDIRKQPTRESMIILWMLEYCFLSTEDIVFQTENISYIERFYGIKIDEAQEYVRVNIRKIFSKRIGCKNPSDWGATCVQYINYQLNQFHWFPLNERNSFDRRIMALKYIGYEVESKKLHWRYKSEGEIQTGELINFKKIEEEGSPYVPPGLQFLFYYFSQIKEITEEKLPLECKIYEIM